MPMDLVTLGVNVVHPCKGVLGNAESVVGTPALKEVVRRQVSDVTCAGVEFDDAVGPDCSFKLVAESAWCTTVGVLGVHLNRV